jgi:hypothetical protein
MLTCRVESLLKALVVGFGILLLLPTLALAWPGKVLSIQDADTITVLTEDKQQVRKQKIGA